MTYTKGTLSIAQFMGLTPIKNDENYYYFNSETLQNEKLPIYITWNELMPVIEKISSYKFPDAETEQDTAFMRTFGMLNAETKQPMVRINRFQLFEADNLITAAYMAVVCFIEYFNSDSAKNEKPKLEPPMGDYRWKLINNEWVL